MQSWEEKGNNHSSIIRVIIKIAENENSIFEKLTLSSKYLSLLRGLISKVGVIRSINHFLPSSLGTAVKKMMKLSFAVEFIIV